MNGKLGGSGAWQVILADLSLILFMTVLAGLAASGSGKPELRPDTAIATGQAVYRTASTGPTLNEWLDLQTADSRSRLTIQAYYKPGDSAAVSRDAFSLWSQASRNGIDTRLIIEMGSTSDVYAFLAYDRSSASSAE